VEIQAWTERWQTRPCYGHDRSKLPPPVAPYPGRHFESIFHVVNLLQCMMGEFKGRRSGALIER